MFKNIFKKKQKVNLNNLGVIDDPRNLEEKQKDYKSEELFSASLFEWKEKPESEWRKFPIFNQSNSSSCVAQAVTKALGIENYIEEGKFVHLSARDIYTRRSNFPSTGMYFQQGMDIGHNQGATIEQLMPSQGIGELLMNDSSDRTPLTDILAKIVRGGNYLNLPINIDDIASFINRTGKGVVLGVRFGNGEWNKDVPTINGTDTKYGHGVCAVDYTLHNGKKALIIEDSWGDTSGLSGRRIVTEDWFTAGRIIYAGYYIYLSNTGLPEDDKPSYIFTRDLSYGLRNDEDVKKLQECLAYLEMFPSDYDFTGNFYSITLNAVKEFQLKYDIKPVKGYVGKLTRAKLNELFNK